LNVTRQGFYNYLEALAKPWKHEALAAEIRKIIEEDESNGAYGHVRIREALLLKKASSGGDFPDVPGKETLRRILMEMGL
jgi:hypothetical protein